MLQAGWRSLKLRYSDTEIERPKDIRHPMHSTACSLVSGDDQLRILFTVFAGQQPVVRPTHRWCPGSSLRKSHTSPSYKHRSCIVKLPYTELISAIEPCGYIRPDQRSDQRNHLAHMV